MKKVLSLTAMIILTLIVSLIYMSGGAHAANAVAGCQNVTCNGKDPGKEKCFTVDASGHTIGEIQKTRTTNFTTNTSTNNGSGGANGNGFINGSFSITNITNNGNGSFLISGNVTINGNVSNFSGTINGTSSTNGTAFSNGATFSDIDGNISLVNASIIDGSIRINGDITTNGNNGVANGNDFHGNITATSSGAINTAFPVHATINGTTINGAISLSGTVSTSGTSNGGVGTGFGGGSGQAANSNVILEIEYSTACNALWTNVRTINNSSNWSSIETNIGPSNTSLDVLNSSGNVQNVHSLMLAAVAGQTYTATATLTDGNGNSYNATINYTF